MDQLDAPKKLAELLEPDMTLMVGMAEIASSGTMRVESRPLTVADIQDDTIRVLVDTTADWAQRARNGERAHVTVSDNRKNVWAGLNAAMMISTDSIEIDEVWNPFAAAYFEDGRNSPNIGVLHLRVDGGMYWSTPSGRVGALISLIKTKFGDASQSGEHGIVDA